MPTPALPLPPPAHAAALPPARPGPGGVRLLTGVPYAEVPGVRPLELDLYLPAEGPAPVVVFLHGGGWRLGSRHAASPAYPATAPFEQLARAGIAVASVDYRLSGEAVWPTQLHDAKAAVRWLRARAGELGVDPDRIAAWGESAGGHLAELLGLTADDPALEGDVGVTGPSSAVAAVAAWYAPSDVAAVATDIGADPMDPASREAQLLGAPAPTVPEVAAQAGPVHHVSPAAPPFLLLHGRDDRFVPCVQSERLATALRAAGADVDLHVYDGADHMWLGAPDAARDALERTITFLRRRLVP
ncbi:alpha/beta hydrolase [Pseudonocardia nigra]|uniref:alpha/beta hydrolase n=1 Tax=Pseudonocardia nigra TaxID=1921578 RepID=UPI001C5F659E|nr:alpha/beta hydrolase [Pseudonocardia nigra]